VYETLKQSYQASYDDMTSENFWRLHLGLAVNEAANTALPGTKDMKTDV
jgi:hypothetical protein